MNCLWSLLIRADTIVDTILAADVVWLMDLVEPLADAIATAPRRFMADQGPPKWDPNHALQALH